MAIEKLGKDGFVVTGESDIALYRLVVLCSALRFEIKGLHRRGRSVYSIVKEEFGFKGNKERVLAQLEALVVKKGEERAEREKSTSEAQ